jgi:hypothetical protein
MSNGGAGMNYLRKTWQRLRYGFALDDWAYIYDGSFRRVKVVGIFTAYDYRRFVIEVYNVTTRACEYKGVTIRDLYKSVEGK